MPTLHDTPEGTTNYCRRCALHASMKAHPEHTCGTPHEPTGWEMRFDKEFAIAQWSEVNVWTSNSDDGKTGDIKTRREWIKDFIRNIILEEKSKSYAEGQSDEREVIIALLEFGIAQGNPWYDAISNAINIIKSRRNK